MTCTNCVHFADCFDIGKTRYYGKDCACNDVEERCKFFKNKADFVEVKHGKWLTITNGLRGWKCSLCDEHICVEPPRNVDRYLYPFCPGCGAKMKRGNK